MNFQYNTRVTNVIFDIQSDKKGEKQIVCIREGKEATIDLAEDVLVFVTNGSCLENSSLDGGDHSSEFRMENGGCWELWRNIARQDLSFGHPDKFCTNTKESKWESATVITLDSRIPKCIEKICKRDPSRGKVATGGIIAVKDFDWLMSYTFNRQPVF